MRLITLSIKKKFLRGKRNATLRKDIKVSKKARQKETFNLHISNFKILKKTFFISVLKMMMMIVTIEYFMFVQHSFNVHHSAVCLR